MSFSFTITNYVNQIDVNSTSNVVTVQTTSSAVQVIQNGFINIPVPGPTGPTGPQGQQGGMFLGSTNVYPSLRPDGTTLVVGDFFVFNDQSAQPGVVYRYFFNPVNQSFAWQDQGNITGPTGATGPVGAVTTATTSTLGVIRIGQGLNIDLQGVVSVTGLNTSTNAEFASLKLGGVVNSSVTVSGITGTGQQQLDTWSTSTFQSAKYLIDVRDAGALHIMEVIVAHNAGDVIVTEYGIVTSNGLLGEFNYDVSSGQARVLFTPTTATSMTVKIAKTLVAV